MLLRAQFLWDLLLRMHAKLHEVDSPAFVSLAKALLGITWSVPPGKAEASAGYTAHLQVRWATTR